MKQVLKFLVKWFLFFLLASVAIFWFVRQMPVSPAEQMLSYYQLPATPENIAIVEKDMGLDKPLPQQYVQWIVNFVRGDWGVSYVSHMDIRSQFMKKMPYSFGIGIGGMLISAVISFFLGYGAALKPGRICDRLSELLVILSRSFPEFLMSIVVIYVVGVKFKLVKFFTGNGFLSFFIAILITAVYMTGTLSRVCKVHFEEQLQQSYVRFAVSRGFSKGYVLLHHSYKPVLYGMFSAMIAKFAWILGGSSVLEFAFTIPGISYFLVDSMKARDYMVLQTYVLVLLIWMFFVHLVFRVLLQFLDVRSRA
ncbi:MAG: ABC transporter permease [Lachnospiraceae bacterium]|nr:ABC transporter permease [Lachnospiraceae bacterium]